MNKGVMIDGNFVETPRQRNTLTNLVYNLNRYEQVLRLGIY